MKKLILVSIFILCTAQFYLYPQERDERGIGSAKTLEGNVYILTVFISDPQNNWTYSEKIDVFNKYHEALDWLKRQASNYNVKVNFEGGDFGLNDDIKLDYIEVGRAAGNENVMMVSTVLQKIGYLNSLSFYNWAMDKGYDNTLVLIFAKDSGIGYAMSYETTAMNKDLYYVEGILLYKNYLNGRELAAASIAHEILHNFGAWDLYATFQQSRHIEEMARMFFQNSIMHRVAYNINELDIDPVTAWRIGWNNNPESWYYNFNPHR